MIKIAVRLRLHPQKRRTGLQRLKSRLYYRKNRSKIRLQRRRYRRKYKTTMKHRKMFQRFKPTWFKHAPKRTLHRRTPQRIHTFKVHVPKSTKRKKVD